MNADQTAHTGLRRVAMAALAAGAVVSAALTLYVGVRSNAPGLIAPFEVWVLVPFAVLGWALTRSGAWSSRMQIVLSWAAVIVAAGSIAAYAQRVAWPPRAQGAFVFVAVPPLSLLFAAAVAAAARVASGAGSARAGRR